METMLVLEALFHNLLEQEIGPNTTVSLSCRKSLGTIQIKIGFEGKMAYLYTMEDAEFQPEDQILRAYEDRIGCSYHSGYNSFQINVRRNHRLTFLHCAVGIVCAVLVFLLLKNVTTRKEQILLLANIIVPIEQLLWNVVFMIGAPVTFFSLVKNLMNTYILADRYSGVRKLRGKAIVTAVIMILIAVGVGFLLLSRFQVPPDEDSGTSAIKTFSHLISEAVPSSIFEPFAASSPIPLLILALIVTVALSSAGRYFEKLKTAVDIGYSVFSRMLSLVLFAFPFFIFVSLLDMLLIDSLDSLLPLLRGILLILAGTPAVLLFYLIRLKIGGVRILPFLKKLPPLLLENCRINSSIDATPFNIRYCVRHYGMNRKRLERSLPVLAQTMFDGNCYTLMSAGILLSFELGKGTWYNLLVLALLVVFLSLGAPNQPGTFLVGAIIILRYLGYDGAGLMYVAIFFEACLGIVQNLINVMGDIVTVTIEEQRSKDGKHLSGTA